jgi:hypothetical protein
MKRLIVVVLWLAGFWTMSGCATEDAAVDDQEQVGSVEQAEETAPVESEEDMINNGRGGRARCDGDKRNCDSLSMYMEGACLTGAALGALDNQQFSDCLGAAKDHSIVCKVEYSNCLLLSGLP